MTTIIDPREADEGSCSICLCAFNEEQVYTMPECGHKFHTNCIFHWLRGGNIRCPYCNNEGQELNNREEFSCRCCFNNERYKLLRKQAMKKDCPIILKKLILRLRKLENNLKEIRVKHKEIKDKTFTYKDWLKIHYKNRRQLWNVNIKIRRLKREICECQIVPLIIVERRII